MTPTRRLQPIPQTFVLDSEALALAVRGDRAMLARLANARDGHVDVITSPMTLIEAHDPRTPAARWNWVVSRMRVATIGKDEARAARELLTAAGLHGHKYAIDAVLAVVAMQQPGFVTVFTSDVDDLERLLPPTVLVRKV
ncbi:DNA-binding protein [Nocardia asteroides]|uniref:DNA-binding protein n=1 Tax=Nocardia asteroides TaxID=1824 RepID=UPI001E56E921|nr:DNA-binding protein [Nocardia asteroides]UGT58961.1 DNA-binding protein [Nocardia asteroides]